ncbi:hypothetical protein CBR_g34240 [Chara braunii]|uniref:Uncharacterized protein n=1 Tax=Chara braunii TaxID=69332 RepID=A0A388JYK2_CHABU|nr:hypothetical protein CBR_g34240 [Chara braunii]|eukprot:GBG62868.1 hypothetical protein CBR_g34240 [Chara braunii]
MSFITERALDEQLLQPRGHISEIRQVRHPRLSTDLQRLAQFFCDVGVCAAAAFRFEESSQAMVLVEVIAVDRRAAPGTSHVTTVAAFSGDISSLNPRWHTTILTSLREWTEQVSNVWHHGLARPGHNLISTFAPDLGEIRRSPREPPSDLHPSLSFSFEPLSVPLINPGHWRLWRETFDELSFYLARVQVTWTQASEHPAWIRNLELLIIQAWKTNMEGDLLGFLFGSVWPGRHQLIVQELIAPIVQLADDLPPEIVSQSDDNPAPHVLTRSLDPYLQWTACLEEPRDEDTLPSRQEYLKPYDIIPHAFYPKVEEVVIDDGEEDDDEETSEEGSYCEYSEGELSEEEEEEEEETGSEWEALPEEAARTGTETEQIPILLQPHPSPCSPTYRCGR